MSALYPEPTFSRVSGIRKGLLAEARKASCIKGTDWVLNESTVVCYTETGLQKICATLKLDQAGLQEDLAEEIPPTTATPPASAAEAPASTGEASEQDGAGATTLLASEKIPSGPSGPSGPAVSAERPAAGTTSAAELPAGSSAAPLPSPIGGGTNEHPKLNSTPVPRSVGPESLASSDAAAVIGRGVARAAGEEVAEITITSVPVNGNRRLLYGTLEDPAEKSGRRRVTIRVRDNAFFLQGFVVRATPASAGYYNFVGRLPRWRGDRFGFTAKPKPKDADGGTT